MPSSQCARVNLLGKQGKEISVSAEENKAIVRRWFEDLFNGGNLDVADEIVALNHVTYDPALPDVLSGPEGQKQVVSLYRDAFPDAHITVEHQIAVGNEV
jgi:hypothetical protein